MAFKTSREQRTACVNLALWANSKHRDASRINVAVHNTLLPWCISVILSEFGAFSGGGGETIIERVRVKYYTLLI